MKLQMILVVLAVFLVAGCQDKLKVAEKQCVHFKGEWDWRLQTLEEAKKYGIDAGSKMPLCSPEGKIVKM